MSAEYDKYLKKHINAVKICYKLLTGKVLSSHDKSKYLKGIYKAYDQKFYGKHPNENLFDYAWLIHQNKEPHHWQYWVLIKDTGEMVPKDMPIGYIYEMIADWASFSLNKRDPNSLKTWYDDNKDKMILHSITREKVEKLLPIMISKLEKYLKKH